MLFNKPLRFSNLKQQTFYHAHRFCVRNSDLAQQKWLVSVPHARVSSEKAVFCCYKGDTISPRLTKMVGEREEKLKSRSLFSRNIHMLNSLSNQINIKELKLFISSKFICTDVYII